MPDDKPRPTPEALAQKADLLMRVERATARRPPNERREYEKAQDSVVEARRVAQERAASLKIVS
jgi:hypothetical protein